MGFRHVAWNMTLVIRRDQGAPQMSIVSKGDREDDSSSKREGYFERHRVVSCASSVRRIRLFNFFFKETILRIA